MAAGSAAVDAAAQGAARRAGGADASGAVDPSAGPRRIKQLGVDNVLSGGPGTPWTEQSLNTVMERWKAMDITVGNLMINLSNDIIYGKPGNKRDEDIEKVKASVIAAGKVGLPVVEYNFYAHRAMEGYFEEIDTARGNSGWTGFDYELVQTAAQQYQTRAEEKGMKFKDLPALPNEGRAQSGRDVEQHHLFSARGDSDGGEGGGSDGPAPERSAGAGEPGLAADYGFAGRLEEADHDRQQPLATASRSIAA